MSMSAINSVSAIDRAPLSDDSSGAMAELAHQVHDAYYKMRFTHGANHRIFTALVEDVFAGSQRFHAVTLKATSAIAGIFS
tara:strand:+ start:721 stop:963 length:243 start_codon:yes stop_codon:yes gene_type:complete